LPEELRPAYVVATAAAQAGISAETATPKAREMPPTNRPPVHITEPALDETLRNMLETLE